MGTGHGRAAVLAVGSELVLGTGTDTNSAEVARALGSASFEVTEVSIVGDDRPALAEAICRLTSENDVVVVTGGLGPTHDDVTREAASDALGLPLSRDPRLEEALLPVVHAHREAGAGDRVLAQADVLTGAEVICPTGGTAPGQIVPTPRGVLVLLPGPPEEMRPMLELAMAAYGRGRTEPRVVSCAGVLEVDAQVVAQRVMSGVTGVRLTLLAKPGQVQVVLIDDGAGEDKLAAVSEDVAGQFGDDCFSRDGRTLPEVVLDSARDRGVTLGTAESCTGGMVAAALTDVAGASDCFVGSIVSYSDSMKKRLLGVPEAVLSRFGAVSVQTAGEMARGAQSALGCDITVSVTGIAGPGGGTAAKPVGTVCVGLAGPEDTLTLQRVLFGDRQGVRSRATILALDALRRSILGLPPPEGATSWRGDDGR